jgi:putative ABC transport system permease protein
MQPLRGTPTEWGETWQLAWQALRANKVRAMLTMLGVVIGSACIVLVVTVALAGKRYIIGQIEAVGSNLIYAELIHSGGARPLTLADEITAADLQAVQQSVPSAVEVAGTVDIPMSVSVNGREHPINLVGVTSGFQKIRNLVVLQGRFLDQDDMMTQSKVCLLTPSLATLMFLSESPLGRDIRVGELHFTVVGVFKERVATFGQTEIRQESVIVPFSLIKYYTGTDYLHILYVQADRPEDVPGVTREVADVLQSRHRAEAKYHVDNLAGILEAAHKISLALTVLLVLIALIALTISGIGIMNIMLVTVTERTREIGIRKAIGARRDAILYQFLMEALLISGTGALAGIIIAVSIPVMINSFIRLFPEAGGVTIPVSWVSVVLAFIVSCSTGLLFGYLPANRAARLHPTESLRYE